MTAYGLLQRMASFPFICLAIAALASLLIPGVARVFTRRLGQILGKSHLMGAKLVRNILKEATMRNQ